MVGSQCNGAFSGSTAAAFEAKNQVLPTVSHFFPDRRGPFLDRLVNRNWRSGAGMTKQLFEAFNEVGWTWTDAETMVHSSGLHLKWLQDSVAFVNNVLEKAWIRHVAAQIHRSNFDIESFDAQACVKMCEETVSSPARDTDDSGIWETCNHGCLGSLFPKG